MKLHLPVFLRRSVLSCLVAVVACTMGSGAAWADAQNLTYGDSSLIWDTQRESFVNEAGNAAAFATGDNVSFSGESHVSLGENITAGTVVIEKDADVTIDLGEFELDADRIELGGTLAAGDSLSIDKGSTLEIIGAGAVLDSNLVLGEKGVLSITGAGGSLGGHSLTLQQGASLILSGAVMERETTDADQDGELSLIVTPTGDGKTYTLLTGVSQLVDKEGNALTAGSYSTDDLFDSSQPGAGFWAGGTLVYAADGTLTLVRHNKTVKDALEVTTRQTRNVYYSYYAGISFKNLTTTDSSGGAIYGHITITLSDNGSVSFIGNTASGDYVVYGGAIYGDSGSTITLSNNGSVEFVGNTASSSSSSAYGGAIYGTTITLSNNGSVVFVGNTASSSGSSFYGGAIYGDGDITLSNNGRVEFSGNTASRGGAIYGDFYSTIMLSNNGRVEFIGNTASSSDSFSYGGAIYGDGNIMLSNNGSVVFEGNTASSSSSSDGGAIYGDGNIMLSNNGSVVFEGNTASSSSSSSGGAIYGDGDITLSNNGRVEFIGNTASSYASSGGAIHGEYDSTIMLSNNGSVEFIGNTAFSSVSSSYGGAIYGGNDSTISLSNNGSVEFIGNTASSSSGVPSYGGAIYGDFYSTISLSNNGRVEFSGNTAASSDSFSYGGAIYGRDYSTIMLSNNGSVVFSGNTASSDFYSYGGAIRSYGDLSIRNNDSVLFEKNVEKSGSSYRLRSIYADGSGDVISLSAAAGKSIEFRDSVYIASVSTVKLNEDYTYLNAEGVWVTAKQQGDILFTGKYTESHLNALLAAAEAGRTATAEEILSSRTTEVRSMTNLYGGRLRVEDGAIYKGRGITAMEGSAATVRVQNATLSHSGYDLTFNAGTTLELAGNNTIIGDVQMLEGSILCFDGGETKGTTSLTGNLSFASNADIALRNGSNWTGQNEILLYVEGAVSGLNDGSYGENSDIRWVNGDLLVLNYNKETFALRFNGDITFATSQTSKSQLKYYNSVRFENIASSSSAYGGAIHGGKDSTITLSNNGSVVFDGNTASSSSGFSSSAYGGAIYGGKDSTITLSNNGSVVFDGNTASSSSGFSSSGGAIYVYGDITLSNNGSVVFRGNTASSSDSSYGGAILSYGDLSIRNNDSVLFEKNVEKYGSSYRLRGIYAGGSGDVISLSAAAGKSIEFRDSVYIASGSTVKLNEDYTYLNAEGVWVTSKQTGDILFTGKYTEQHLKELLDAADAGRTSTAVEILNSRTSGINALTKLYGGRLRVEDGAVYQGYGIEAMENSAATVRVQNAVLHHAGYDLVFQSGTMLELMGNNTIMGDVQMQDGSTLLLNATDSQGMSSLAGNLNLSGEMILAMGGNVNPLENSILLYVNGDVEGWNEDRFTISGAEAPGGVSATWVDNLLVLNYNAATFDPFFNKTVTYTTQQAPTIYHHYEDIRFTNVIGATFSGMLYDDNGAIHGTNVILNHNGNVNFSKNEAAGYGGGIYGTNIELAHNETVTFNENSALNGNGGAIYGILGSSVRIHHNDKVEFSKNTAGRSGGAIGLYTTSTAGRIELSHNGSVEFCENDANSGGGALFGGTIILSHNGSLKFSENNSGSTGGAIQGTSVTLSNNGSVEFSGNTASSSGSSSYGGAIYWDGDLSIRNNDSVLFEKNVEKSGSSYRLRSICAGDSGAVISLSAAAGKSIEFRDSVYIASGSTVKLNEDYTYLNAEGVWVTVKQQGDILFTGKYTEQHLKELLDAADAGRTATTEEILDSRTIEVYALTELYGGRLRVEDGAVYQGYGIEAMENSAATVRVQNAVLNHAGYNLTFHAGTTLELVGSNTLSGELNLLRDSTLALEISRFGETNTLSGALTIEDGVKLSIRADVSGMEAATNGTIQKLVVLSTTSSNSQFGEWDITDFSITTTGSWGYKEGACWEDGQLIVLLKYADTVTWNNDSGDFKWNGVSQNWADAEYKYTGVNGANVILGSIGAGTLELDGEVQLKSLTVTDASAYVLEYADGARLSMIGSLNVGEGSSLQLGGSVSAGSVQNAGELAVQGNLQVAGAVQNTGSLELQGGLVAQSLQSTALNAASLLLMDSDAANMVSGDLNVSGDITVAGSLSSGTLNGSAVEVNGALSATDVTVDTLSAGMLTADSVAADSLNLTQAGAANAVIGAVNVTGDVMVAGSLSAGTLNGAAISVNDALSADTITAATLNAGSVEAGTLNLMQADAVNTVTGAVNVTGDVMVAGSLNAGSLNGAAVMVNDALSADTITAAMLRAGSVEAGTLNLTQADAVNMVTGSVNVSGDIMVAGILSAGTLNGAAVMVNDALSADTITAAMLNAGSVEAGTLNLTQADAVNMVTGAVNVRGNISVAGSLDSGDLSGEVVTVAGNLSAGAVQTMSLQAVLVTAASLQTDSLQTASLTLTDAAAGNTIGGPVVLSGDALVAGSLTVADRFSANNVRVDGDFSAVSLQAASLVSTGAVNVTGDVMVAGSLSAGTLNGGAVEVNGALSATDVMVDTLSAGMLTAGSVAADSLNLTQAGAANAVTGAVNVTGDIMVAGSLSAGTLNGAAISVNDALSADTITAATLNAGSVDAGTLNLMQAAAVNTVTGAVNVTGDVMVAGSLNAGSLNGAAVMVNGALSADTITVAMLSAGSVEAGTLNLTQAAAVNTVTGAVNVTGDITVAGSLSADTLNGAAVMVNDALSADTITAAMLRAGSVEAGTLNLTQADAVNMVTGAVNVTGDIMVAGSLDCGDLSGEVVTIAGNLSAGAVQTMSLQAAHVTAASLQTDSLQTASLTLTDAAAGNTIGGPVVLSGDALVAGSLTVAGRFSANNVRVDGDFSAVSLNVASLVSTGAVELTGSNVVHHITGDMEAASVSLATGATLDVGGVLTAAEVQMSGTAQTGVSAAAFGADTMNFVLDRAALESLNIVQGERATIACSDHAFSAGFNAMLNGSATESVDAAAYTYAIATSGNMVQVEADYRWWDTQVWYRGAWVGESSWDNYLVAGYDAIDGVETIDLGGDSFSGFTMMVELEDGVDSVTFSNGSLDFEYIDMFAGQLNVGDNTTLNVTELYAEEGLTLGISGEKTSVTVSDYLEVGEVSLDYAKLYVAEAEIATLSGTTGCLTIADDGAVTIGSDVTLSSLTNGGSLDVSGHKLVVNGLTEKGGNVTAGEVETRSNMRKAATFDCLIADKVTVTNSNGNSRYTDDLSVGDGSAIGELVAETLELRDGSMQLGRDDKATSQSLQKLKLAAGTSMELNENTALAVTGTLDASANTTVSMKQGASLSYGDVHISNKRSDATASVTAKELAAGTGAIVTNAHATFTDAAEKSVDYQFANSSVENAGSKLLTLTNSASTLSGLHATGGNVDVQALGDITLAELEIAAARTISAAAVTVTELVKLSDGAKLAGNLTLASGATVDLGDTLTLEGALNLQTGLTLSGTVLETIAGLEEGQSHILFSGVTELDVQEAMTLSNMRSIAARTQEAVSYRELMDGQQVSAADYFSNLSGNTGLVISYNKENGTVSISHTLAVPEPTTATLSLLALAALAERRRRK